MRPYVFALALFSSAAGLTAQQEHHHAEPAASLGTVAFPTSCSPKIAVAVERGVALLHSFGYDQAREQFEEIETKDPSCAMAYWGEAMTYYHQLWDRPSATQVAAGWKLVEKARAADPKTERERGYVEATAAFYGGTPQTSYADRSGAYSRAMEALYQRFPKDHEAATFYALSLLASPHANDNDFADRKKAVSILNAILRNELDHPGVAHYLIHACDNPEMAQEGLAAARRYAQIAPASAHALHMPSHIFTRLGMWQEDIRSNLVSKAAAEKQKEIGSRTHAMSFLEYAYLQTGEKAKAKAIVDEALNIPAEEYRGSEPGFRFAVDTRFRTLFVLETRDWRGAANRQAPAGAAPDFQAQIYWAQAVGAGHLRDAKAAREAVENYDQALEAVKKTPYAYVAEQMTVSRDEAHAWMQFAGGDSEGATRLLREAAERQDKTGKAEVDLPAREMLADMLFELHRPAESLAEYQRSMKTDPNRFNALYGASRAAEAAGDRHLADSYRKRLAANCPDGDRTELAANTGSKGSVDGDNTNH